jgi:hypothetical protein
MNFSALVVPEKVAGFVGIGTAAVTPFLVSHTASSSIIHACP